MADQGHREIGVLRSCSCFKIVRKKVRMTRKGGEWGRNWPALDEKVWRLILEISTGSLRPDWHTQS